MTPCTELLVLGSGSRGNCIAIRCGDAALLVDAGFSAREIGRRAEAAGLCLEQVVGLVLTHEHGDHAGGAARLARTLRLPVLTATGTWKALQPRMGDAVFLAVGSRCAVEAGPFRVEGCPTSHDAADPLAVVVACADGARVGIAYDLGRPTAAVRYLLRELTAVVLEANHDEVLLRTSGYPPSVQQRIAGAGGHLSNHAAAELLTEIHHPGLGVVVLAHLSQRCNAEAAAQSVVGEALRRVGFQGTFHIARQDQPLPVLPVRPPRRGQLQLL